MKILVLIITVSNLQAASLRGTIRDGATRAPVERALVRLVSADKKLVETSTGRDGRFVFNALPGARYTVQAVADGFLPLDPQALELTASEDRRDYELRLNPELRINGRVMKSPDEPASAVTVEARQNGVAIATDWSDANGVFRLTGLAPGRYEIVAVRGITWEPVRGKSFTLTRLAQPVTVIIGEPIPRVEIRLRRLAVFRVRLKLTGTVASLMPVEAPPPLNVYDLAERSIPTNGCLVIDDVFTGTYNLVVDGGPPTPVTVPVRPGC